MEYCRVPPRRLGSLPGGPADDLERKREAVLTLIEGGRATFRRRFEERLEDYSGFSERETEQVAEDEDEDDGGYGGVEPVDENEDGNQGGDDDGEEIPPEGY